MSELMEGIAFRIDSPAMSDTTFEFGGRMGTRWVLPTAASARTTRRRVRLALRVRRRRTRVAAEVVPCELGRAAAGECGTPRMDQQLVSLVRA
jgi:hypothetical protein